MLTEDYLSYSYSSWWSWGAWWGCSYLLHKVEGEETGSHSLDCSYHCALPNCWISFWLSWYQHCWHSYSPRKQVGTINPYCMDFSEYFRHNNYVLCDYSSVVGDGRDVLLSSCNYDCTCNSTLFEPVCGADDLTYFSPCRAGCQKSYIDDNQDVCKISSHITIVLFIHLNQAGSYLWELYLCGRKPFKR